MVTYKTNINVNVILSISKQKYQGCVLSDQIKPGAEFWMFDTQLSQKADQVTYNHNITLLKSAGLFQTLQLPEFGSLIPLINRMTP